MRQQLFKPRVDPAEFEWLVPVESWPAGAAVAERPVFAIAAAHIA